MLKIKTKKRSGAVPPFQNDAKPAAKASPRFGKVRAVMWLSKWGMKATCVALCLSAVAGYRMQIAIVPSPKAVELSYNGAGNALAMGDALPEGGGTGIGDKFGPVELELPDLVGDAGAAEPKPLPQPQPPEKPKKEYGEYADLCKAIGEC
jgi:hypothetical protein